MEIQVIRFSFSVSDIIKKTFWHRKVRRIFVDYKEVWKGGRVVDYSGLENRRAERHRGFESLPFRKESEKVLQNFLQNLFC